MKIFLLLFALMFACDPAVMSSEKCFKYSGGGFDDEIRLTVNGTDVTGALSVGRTNSEMPTRLYQFTGTVSKGVMTLRFENGAMPTAFERTGDKMTAEMSGKNLVVKVVDGSKEVYSATFTPCG